MIQENLIELTHTLSYKERRSNMLRTDCFFKYLMIDDVKGEGSLAKMIIEAATGFRPQGIILSGNDMPPIDKDGKVGRLDFHVIDNERQQYDIEMQCEYHQMYDNIRFQVYCAKLLLSGEKKGEDYSNMPTAFVICFVDHRHSDRLVDQYKIMHVITHSVLEENRMNIIYVNLSYIDTILKTKRLSELSAFEKIVYMFKKGLTDDILKEKDAEVNYIMEVYEKFERSAWYTQAEFELEKKLRDEWVNNDRVEKASAKAREIALAEGHAEGLAEGHAEGLAEGHAEGLAEGLAQGRMEGIKETEEKFRKEYELKDQEIAALKARIEALETNLNK